ncbi:conjugal transfer protein [Listeria innocua]|uniref:conjugal transfer protein n=1 Tax=Listeria innocua TaxID=1642 RepID=UPI00162A1299|nr:conjugal transfer protein [Listeria innocua]MBC1385726.1 conjugal transfer protein [Listeria innocua]HAC4846981.1 conjugal transfer protein [Listeria monocytogenes]
MKIKIERKEKPEKSNKQKKTPTIKGGTHKKLTIALWVLLIGSISFGVYKNFTAIDRHTIHEKEIIEQRIVDTNNVESFVEAFANEYFSWQQGQDSIDSRNERLKEYFTERLQQLNVEMVRVDIPTSSVVRSVQIWYVSQSGENDFEVVFSVEQQLTEGKKETNIVSTYNVLVHVDKAGNMVVTKNPTMDSQPQRSSYEPKQIESDGRVDAEKSEEITSFLETFFKLYPSANEKELAYYVSNHTLPVVQKNYVFAELVNPVYIINDNQVNVIVTVKYLDQETKTTQLSQYELTLEKQENWKIIR